MKKSFKNKGWKQKIVRIRPEYIKLCSYYEFLATYNDLEPYLYMDNVLKTSLNSLLNNKQIDFEISDFSNRRKPKGFNLSNSTYRMLNEILEIYSTKNLYISEIFEILLAYYFIYFIPSNQKKAFEFKLDIKFCIL